MKLFKNIRTYGWAVLPQTRPVPFRVLKNRFVWLLCSQLNTFKIMAGPPFPTSPVTAQLILRRWRIIWFWCCADFQQRSNERLVVLPQTRSSSLHGVENYFHLDRMKCFKNIRTYGWAVLPQTRPSCFHGVEKPVWLDYNQPCKNIQVDGWARVLNTWIMRNARNFSASLYAW